MNYEEKRELRLQISQLLADAGLNQKTIKDMVEKEIKDKVFRAVDQCMNNLNAQSSSGDFVSDRVKYILDMAYYKNNIADAVKEEIKNRIIKVELKNVEL